MRLKDFEDFNAEGTIGKNNQIYTSLYDYHISKNDRSGVVGWLGNNSQLRNYLHALDFIEEGDFVLDYGCGIGDFLPFLSSNLDDFDYTGVDINPVFIDEAKRSYPSYDFYLINSPEEINFTFDTIVAIGVFTWYITKEDFEKTIRHLFEKCKKRLVITCISSIMVPHSWTKTYRGYNDSIFLSSFPSLKKNMKFYNRGNELVIVFNK